MSRALCVDLRFRVLAAVGQSLSHHQAGEARELEQGDVRPKALGGDRRFGRVEAASEMVLSITDECVN